MKPNIYVIKFILFLFAVEAFCIDTSPIPNDITSLIEDDGTRISFIEFVDLTNTSSFFYFIANQGKDHLLLTHDGTLYAIIINNMQKQLYKIQISNENLELLIEMVNKIGIAKLAGFYGEGEFYTFSLYYFFNEETHVANFYGNVETPLIIDFIILVRSIIENSKWYILYED